MRDWIDSLWPASFGGVPFFVEKDEAEFGKKVVVHEFPQRDTPFVEELGQSARRFEFNAYVASDAADSDADALVATFTAAGFQMLVLPDQGPVLCMFIKGKRIRERDKMGYVAFSLSFVAQGAASAVVSVPYLGQMVFDAASAMAGAAAGLLDAVSLASLPNWVIADVAGGLQDLVATLETIAASNGVDGSLAAAFKTGVATGPAPSASVAATTAPITGLSNAMVALYNVTPMLVTNTTGVDPSLPAGLFAICLGLSAAIAPASAVAAFAAAADALPDAPPAPTQTVNRLADAANMEIVARFGRGLLLAGYAQALAGVTYASRPDAITARADCVERFERELNICQGAVDAVFARGLRTLRDSCVAYLSQAIVNLKPVMTVTANRSLTSLWWAWRLYQDPTKASDLIARNKVPHPAFFPTRFEALAP